MNEKLKTAFDQVRAEEPLKDRTKEYLFRRTKGYTEVKRRNAVYCRLIPAVISVLLIFLMGRWLYFTPTAVISIDINPSIELSVNRFGRVISASGYNEDGKALVDTLDLQYRSYEDAVSRILDDDRIAALLASDEIMTIGVFGGDDAQSAEILSAIEARTVQEKNTHCYSGSSDELEEAHEAGLSCGKYQAYLRLRELDPEVTVEDIQNMTMREIRDWINILSGGTEWEESDDKQQEHNGQEYGRQGQDSHGYGQTEHGQTEHGQDSTETTGHGSGHGRPY